MSVLIPYFEPKGNIITISCRQGSNLLFLRSEAKLLVLGLILLLWIISVFLHLYLAPLRSSLKGYVRKKKKNF